MRKRLEEEIVIDNLRAELKEAVEIIRGLTSAMEKQIEIARAIIARDEGAEEAEKATAIDPRSPFGVARSFLARHQETGE